MRRTVVLLTLFACSVACKNDTKQSAKLNDRSLKELETTTEDLFGEGKIDIEIYFPENPMSQVLNKIDPDQGNLQHQFETLSKELSTEDAQKINKVMNGNPMQALMVMFSPLIKNEIFVKGNRATAKCDGLMYHLENSIDGTNNTGRVFLQSQENKNNQLTFNYDEDFFGQSQIQTKIDKDQYNREQTNETRNIAGYKCTKTIYTLKESAAMGVGRLEVWTSGQMPKSLNFIHPYYLEEDNGIMKIDLFFSENTPMVYEFKKVTPRSVAEAEMAIKESQPVYDSKTDVQALGMKIMGIMLGS
jgi:hypothetical protein